MANVLVEESTLQSIADSIRAKSGKTEKMLPSAMASEITNLPSGGGVGNLTKYTKFIATPDSSLGFIIQNPLGGIAKKVFVKIVEPLESGSGIEEYIADNDFLIGVMKVRTSSNDVNKYVATGVPATSPSVGNSRFKIAEGTIELKQYSVTYPWKVSREYEVEIYQ